MQFTALSTTILLGLAAIAQCNPLDAEVHTLGKRDIEALVVLYSLTAWTNFISRLPEPLTLAECRQLKSDYDILTRERREMGDIAASHPFGSEERTQFEQDINTYTQSIITTVDQFNDGCVSVDFSADGLGIVYIKELSYD